MKILIMLFCLNNLFLISQENEVPIPLVKKEASVEAKVTVLLNINYDVKPPENLSDYTCSFTDVKTNAVQFIEHGQEVSPGNYYVEVQRPGYRSAAPWKVTIHSGEESYWITEYLSAKPRGLAIDIVGNACVPASEIINNVTKQSLDFGQKISAGEEISLTVKFRKYATQVVYSVVEPGEGPYVVSVPLVSLKRYEFQSRQEEIVIDGIVYPLAIFIDHKEIENHLVSKEKGFDRFIWEIYANQEAKKIQAYAGYKFIEKPLLFIGMVSRFVHVNVPKFIEHLKLVISVAPGGEKEALVILEKILQEPNKKGGLNKADAKELKLLVQYVASWKFSDRAERERQKLAIEEIQKLIK